MSQDSVSRELEAKMFHCLNPQKPHMCDKEDSIFYLFYIFYIVFSIFTVYKGRLGFTVYHYREIKLINHTMKIWERIIEARLRNGVEINKKQYGFMPGKKTTDAMFALRMLMEKYRDGQR